GRGGKGRPKRDGGPSKAARQGAGSDSGWETVTFDRFDEATTTTDSYLELGLFGVRRRNMSILIRGGSCPPRPPSAAFRARQGRVQAGGRGLPTGPQPVRTPLRREEPY